jgi:hypothetical protein
MGQNICFGGCSKFTGAVLNRKVSHHPMVTGPYTFQRLANGQHLAATEAPCVLVIAMHLHGEVGRRSSLKTSHLLVNLGKTGQTKNTVKSGKTVIHVEIGEV